MGQALSILSILANDAIWPWILVAIAIFVWNAWARAAMSSATSDLRIPERMWTYGASDIEAFAQAARGREAGKQPMLAFYISRVLRQSDPAFALALSSLTAFLWVLVAMTPPAWVWLNWLAWPFAAMAILYGVADIAEDIKLAAILSDGQKVDPAEAAAVNLLTRIKIAALVLSVLGMLIFAATQLLQKAIAWYQARGTPVPV